MNDLRTAAQQALEAWNTGDLRVLGPAMGSLRAALAQEQEQKQKLLEAVRVRIMQTAYDRADDGEFQSYNSVKVLCTEVLEMLK